MFAISIPVFNQLVAIMLNRATEWIQNIRNINKT